MMFSRVYDYCSIQCSTKNVPKKTTRTSGLTCAMASIATVRINGMDHVTRWKYDVFPDRGWCVVPRALKDVCQA